MSETERQIDEFVKKLSADNLLLLIERAQREYELKHNDELTEKLTKALRVIETFVSCSVTYEADERDLIDKSSVKITFKDGEVSINMTVRYTPGNNVKSIKIDTSFGSATYRNSNGGFSNDFKRIPFGKWTIYDTNMLLRIVIRRSGIAYREEFDGITVMRSWNTEDYYELDRFPNDDEENEEKEYEIYQNVASILARYGYSDIQVVYDMSDEYETTTLTLFDSEGEETEFEINCDRHYEVIITYNTITSDDEPWFENDEDYCRIIERLLPVNGKDVTRVEQIRREQNG